MKIYYDVALRNKTNECIVSYWADSFSIDEYRILRVKSSECGNITVKVEDDEYLVVCEVRVDDAYYY